MDKRLLRAAVSLGAFVRHGSLVWELTKREVLGRYRGASFGLVWALLGPLMVVAVYSFAFGEILRSRWPGVGEDGANFALVLFAGLIVHGLFAECLARAPRLIVNRPSYVTKLIFPLEIMPWPMLLSALFHVAMNFVVFVLMHLVLAGPVPLTIFLLPVVLFPLVVFLAGLAWFLSALGVYFRDINEITGPVSTAMLFLSSAMIPVQSLPASYQRIFHLNPLTFIIDQVRNVALWGVLPDWTGLAQFLLMGLVVSYAGCLWFQSTRRGFADVL